MEEIVVWSETGTKKGVSYSYAQMFVYCDGGRKDAGYKTIVGDCVTRAITIISGLPYKKVYDDLNTLGKKEKITKTKLTKSNSRTGIYKRTFDKYLKSIGFKWIPTMTIGSGCKVHLRGDELPKGKIIVRLSQHMVAVIDGVIYDLSDCSRRGKRCVYGYYVKDL